MKAIKRQKQHKTLTARQIRVWMGRIKTSLNNVDCALEYRLGFDDTRSILQCLNENLRRFCEQLDKIDPPNGLPTW